MELIRGLHNLRERHHGCVATIGNFDGVHLGHARVIDQLKSAAEAYDLPGLVILFEPQPQEYFAGQRAPARLMCLSDKLLGMRVHGV
ncbi:MAG: adenylyltransferase/cytidyltransferase family protein, partial [Gammaproteobacteria bacterium]